MSCLNDAYFQGGLGERFQMRAKGFQTIRDEDTGEDYDLWTREAGVSVPMVNGGLSWMRETKIRTGETIYRFASGSADRASLASGEWWFRADILPKLRNLAQRTRSSLPYAAKLAFAVPDQWSDCALLVRATCRKPLRAWEGYGNKASGSGHDIATKGPDDWTASVDPEIRQMFVPGLRNVGATALDVEIV